jgi:hypothetical protein
LMAASATFALKAGVWFRRARLLIVSPDSRVNLARRQAETPLSALFRFARPALTSEFENTAFSPHRRAEHTIVVFTNLLLHFVPPIWWGAKGATVMAPLLWSFVVHQAARSSLNRETRISTG